MEIERIASDGLSREVWRFDIFAPRFGKRDEVNLVVSYYAKQSRATPRHKFREEPQTRYCTMDTRSYYSGVKAEEVPLPDDVRAQATLTLKIGVHPPTVDRRVFG